MTKEIKAIVSREVFDQLDIRLGQIMSVEKAVGALKDSYKITVDFGGYGIKTTVARLTMHSIEELMGKQAMGVLNFEPRQIGDTVSEFLILGVQYPKADSGCATIVTPLVKAKLGSKLM